MVLRRGAPPPSDEDSSSGEEDAFSALSRKSRKGRNASSSSNEGDKSKTSGGSDEKEKDADAQKTEGKSKSDGASSTKRHHHISSARQAKMDALLQELQSEKSPSASGHYGPSGGSTGTWEPDKKGSFVRPGEEHLTTNIFVGNLAPSVTEEELTESFRQFGDLYSVKIMWPRTAEERARGRNTGFVCFMTREDAQEAMDALQDQDPLLCGRRMCLRWGKNVKKSVKRGTGGVPIAPIRKKVHKTKDKAGMDDGENKRRKTSWNTGQEQDEPRTTVSKKAEPREDGHISAEKMSQDLPTKAKSSTAKASLPKYDPEEHYADAIRVFLPSDEYRLKFITTVASFIAKDGSILERKLIEKESSNPKFSFLTGDASVPASGTNGGTEADRRNSEEINERIFYRWRVYAFAQGDGFDSWRTEPFVMVQPHGRFWIPPSLDHEAARREEEAAKKKEEDILAKIEVRKKLAGKKDFMTGRQLEHAKYGSGAGPSSEGVAKLTEFEMEEFNILLKEKLCASRDAICELMAFCFDKSGAAKQISELLREALLDDRPSVSVDTRIARLFLLSDVLFNSQQPGVRNAFRYRDAIEKMAPAVFESLGRHEKGKAGRMTMNKLRNAVSAVLSAWTNWSVYNPMFLDELYARFEGKDVAAFKEKQAERVGKETEEESAADGAHDIKEDEAVETPAAAVVGKPTGGWSNAEIIAGEDVDGEPIENEDGDVDGEELEDDVDGEPLEDDAHDGEPLDEDIDGEALDDVDGEPL